MKAFFQSAEWQNLTAFDTLLHQAANRSLGMTIEQLGKSRFDHALKRFRHAMAYAETECLKNATFPCISTGVKNPPKKRDCLWADSGCGTPCLYRVAEELDLYDGEKI